MHKIVRILSYSLIYIFQIKKSPERSSLRAYKISNSNYEFQILRLSRAIGISNCSLYLATVLLAIGIPLALSISASLSSL